MQFALNEEQNLIDDTVERLLSNESHENIWSQLAELGLLGAALPEALGGTGGGPQELFIIARRLGQHLVATPFLASMVVGSHILQRASALNTASASYADGLLSAMVTGDHRLALAVFEQPTRYGLDRLKTSVSADGHGVILSGSKHYVLDGPTADTIIVAATQGEKITLVAVDSSATGVTIVPYQAVDGTPLATIHFESVRVPANQCLLEAANGRLVLNEALAMAAFCISADIVGACEGALEKTVDYLKIREQFGTRLSSFQALQHRASDLHAELEMLRSLTLGAAQTLSAGVGKQAMADALAAAVMAAEVGDHIGREAIQMHGAVGMTRDLGVGRYLMRANTLTRIFGDADDLRLRYLFLLEEISSESMSDQEGSHE